MDIVYQRKSKRESVCKKRNIITMNTIHISYMNIYRFVWYYTKRHINKDILKAVHYTLFINKGNHIAQDFEGYGIQRQAVVV